MSTLTPLLMIFVFSAILALLIYLPIHLLLRHRRQRAPAAPAGAPLGAAHVLGWLAWLALGFVAWGYGTLYPASDWALWLATAEGKAWTITAWLFLAHEVDRRLTLRRLQAQATQATPPGAEAGGSDDSEGGTPP